MQRKLLLITATWLLAGAASADPDSAPDPVAVAKTCSMCHLGSNTLQNLEQAQLVESIERIRDGQLAHPKIPDDVDAKALAAAIGEPGPTLP